VGRLPLPDAFIYPTDQLPLTAGIVTTLIKGDVFQWGSIMACALMAAAPPVILYAFLMDYYIAGLTAGATKGQSRRLGGEVAQHVAGTAAAGVRGLPARVNPRGDKGRAVTRREERGPRGAMTENRLHVISAHAVTTGGILSAQGAAASKAAAARSTIASCRRRPTIWSPTGRPLLVKPHGTEMTGRLVTVMP
jgi:hypothetical protein